jgi:Cu/Ag efflux protein CusF
MRVRLPLFVVVSWIVPALVFAHGGHKHVPGTVESMNASTITVKTSTGLISVPLSASTRYFRGSNTKHPATANDVENAMRVVVHLGGDGKALEVHIPEMTASEKVGLLAGKIISRDATRNQVTVEHGEVKGLMGAMTMAYEVRGQNVAALPKDGTKITAKLHDSNGTYWLTEVRRR